MGSPCDRAQQHPASGIAENSPACLGLEAELFSDVWCSSESWLPMEWTKNVFFNQGTPRVSFHWRCIFENRTWTCNYIHCFPDDFITHPWHNLNGCLATPPWEEGMGLLPGTKKMRVAHAPGMPRTFPSPPTSKETASYRFRHASRHVHHTLAMMHVGIAKPRWRGKHSRRYRRMCNRQYYVSGKRPIAGKINLLASALSLHNFCKLKRAQDKLHFNFLLDG